MINLFSLFSGIGAFEKALTNLGVPFNLVGYCEIDKYASRSYSAIHGVSEELNYHDVKTVDPKELKNVDLITYGFPCQDISISGYQKGFTNEDGTLTRSGLFFEALRIIEGCKPKVAIAENVKNLVGKKFKKEFEIVLNSLEDAGYNNYWKVLNAKDFGIPQNRERVFIVSIRKDVDTGKFEFPEPYTLTLRLKDLLEHNVDEKYYLSDSTLSYCYNNNKQKELGNGFRFEPTTGEGIAKTLRIGEGNKMDSNFVITVGNVNPSGKGQNGSVIDSRGLARTVTIEKGEGQKVYIPEVIQYGRVNSSQDGVVVDSGISPTLTAGHGNQPKVVRTEPVIVASRGRLEDGKYIQHLEPNTEGTTNTITTTTKDNLLLEPKVVQIGNCKPTKTRDNPNQGRIYDIDGLSPTLNTCGGGGNREPYVVVRTNNKKGFDIAEEEEEEEDSINFEQPNSTTRRGRVGHGVAQTLTTSCNQGVLQGRIRKLTPKECWRLMGFFDSDFVKAEKVNSNTQLYKQAGNSIVVDVLEELFCMMFDVFGEFYV